MFLNQLNEKLKELFLKPCLYAAESKRSAYVKGI